MTPTKVVAAEESAREHTRAPRDGRWSFCTAVCKNCDYERERERASENLAVAISPACVVYVFRDDWPGDPYFLGIFQISSEHYLMILEEKEDFSLECGRAKN